MFTRKCQGCTVTKSTKIKVGAVWCVDCLKNRKEKQLEKRKDYYKKRVIILRKLREN